ncbi:interleukin-6 [Trichechus manatus latirostris]|uniref:Interleukin-6 n=1 Tax=Trichechus manatus latirostris TaxID=127582 RepID=A0A2Y9DMT4_TRIMA|nr:interleukin-6 [Trichechus manatus latirostris]
MSDAHSALQPTRIKRELHLPSRSLTMNFVSTSTFSLVAFCLGLLLVMASAFPTPPLLEGDSKDDATSNRPPLTSPDKTEELINFILAKVSVLRKEMCDKYDKCDNSREALAGNNLNLPKMTEKDRCFQSGFNKETCLMRIVTGLLEFQIYLDYLQNKFEGSKGNVLVVQNSIKALVQILKQKVKNPEEVTTPDATADASLLSKLQPQSEWLKNTTINLILRSLEEFMQFSLRAVRFK